MQTGEWDLLGPEPGKAITHFTGTWGFNFLMASLTVTPLVRRFKQSWALKHRRMLGLFAFFYISLHALAYTAFLLEFQWADIVNEVVERPYLLVGTLSWIILLPLSVTSTRGWQRRLGKRWKQLHKLVYFAVLLACIHYLLQIRAGWFEPFAYTLLTVVLLLLRSKKKV
ncbi:MAG: protein-methionine-sulfoxide reductase heme-binding subunit MsrQ [Thalassolituus sp.]